MQHFTAVKYLCSQWKSADPIGKESCFLPLCKADTKNHFFCASKATELHWLHKRLKSYGLSKIVWYLRVAGEYSGEKGLTFSSQIFLDLYYLWVTLLSSPSQVESQCHSWLFTLFFLHISNFKTAAFFLPIKYQMNPAVSCTFYHWSMQKSHSVLVSHIALFISFFGSKLKVVTITFMDQKYRAFCGAATKFVMYLVPCIPSFRNAHLGYWISIWPSLNTIGCCTKGSFLTWMFT